MRQVFRDPAQQAEFDEKGYILIRNFFDESQVKRFWDHYMDRKTNNEINAEGAYNPVYAEFSIIHSKTAFRKETFNMIYGAYKDKTDKLLDGYKPLIANFIRKEPGGQGGVPVHQNWSVVDEEKYASVSVWVPLVDVDETNGMLQFVDGSHKMFRGKRGSWGSHNFNAVEPLILEKYMTGVPMKAGDALILDDSIIHYSNLNNSDDLRLSCQLIMIPEETQGLYFYKNPAEEGNMIDVFAVDEHYFFDFNNNNDWIGKPENCKPLGKVEFEVPYYSEEEFLELYLNYGKKPKSLLSRLVSLFSKS